ncbi:hypothetical protein BT63DRAFT_425652 [Microthyrium microscopicum]|uniref:Uncharacterized protein n=1 Tax=Microthyrium microscopicum TaxID=703497 RepID=A0A6A6U848_9PEZI|nr:hypothetical protein BT63DRAFT_425652 [Microthyrium microscopicum]
MAGHTIDTDARQRSASIKMEIANGFLNGNGVKSGGPVTNGQTQPSYSFTFADFFRVCSRYELEWAIEETANFLAVKLNATSAGASSGQKSIKESVWLPENVPVDMGRRHIAWPESDQTPSTRAVSLFLGGLSALSLDRANAVTNDPKAKATKVRSKLTTLTALLAIQKRLLTKTNGLAGDSIQHGADALAALEDISINEEDEVSVKNETRLEDTGLLVNRHKRSDSGRQMYLGVRDNHPAIKPIPGAIVVTRPARIERESTSSPTSTLVIPSAGRSSRFPGHKPKWLLTMPNGLLMVVDAIAKLNLTQVHRIVLGVLKEHVEKYCSSDVSALIRAFEDGSPEIANLDLTIVVIDTETIDQVQTVECILKHAKVSGPIFLKDCDNQFACAIPGVDAIATLEIDKDMQNLNIPGGKSYADVDRQGVIHNIVEKVILGPNFCVGGYSFGEARDFLDHVAKARNFQRISYATKVELAVSDVVWLKMITSWLGITTTTDAKPLNFLSIPVHAYEDWGTVGAWEAYCRTFRSLFVDIDGTLVKNAGGYFGQIWGQKPPLNRSVEHLRGLYEKGRTQIILTTSRTEAFREATLKQLEEHGIPYHQIVFGMFHCQRVIVNDYAKTNPFPSATAVNLRRDGDELPEILGTY